MTSFFSTAFLVAFLPASLLAYAATPKCWRWVALLVVSYAFFYILSGTLVGLVAVSTVSIYLLGLWLDWLATRRDERAKGLERAERKVVKARYTRYMRLVVVLGAAFNLSLLISCKYLEFFGGVLGSLLGGDLSLKNLAAPTGISFYSLMAISYLVDVYRGTVRADRNIGHVALFLAFFPLVVEGPFCRYGDTIPQLLEGKRPTCDRTVMGTQRILYGLAKKFIVADRLDIFVKAVFSNYAQCDGGIIAVAAVFYTLELYCDFSGAMDVVCGVGQMFGVTLPENFKQPFFSRSASDFWKRWHITLGAWFRDYIYYPVSLSGPVKRLTKWCRRRLGNHVGPILSSAVALFCVWVANGLWHGAGSQYLFYGMYYFVLIVAGDFAELAGRSLSKRFGIDRSSVPYRAFQLVRTLVIIFVGELFFRAEGLDAGFQMFGLMVGAFNPASIVNGTALGYGLDVQDFRIVGVVLLGVLVVDILKERGHEPGKMIVTRPNLAMASCVALVMLVVVFGAYGAGYAAVAPMYASF